MVRKTLLALCMGTALVMLTACGAEEGQEDMDAAQDAPEVIETLKTEPEDADEAGGKNGEDEAEPVKEETGTVIDDAKDKATGMMDDAEKTATDMKDDMKKQLEGY